MSNHHDAELDLIGCPECGAPTEVVDRVVLPSADGPVEHVEVQCVSRRWFAASVGNPHPAGGALGVNHGAVRAVLAPRTVTEPHEEIVMTRFVASPAAGCAPDVPWMGRSPDTWPPITVSERASVTVAASPSPGTSSDSVSGGEPPFS